MFASVSLVVDPHSGGGMRREFCVYVTIVGRFKQLKNASKLSKSR
jgi:hypothetical protein